MRGSELDLATARLSQLPRHSAQTTNFNLRPCAGSTDVLGSYAVNDDNGSDWHSVPEEDRDPSPLEPIDRIGLDNHFVSGCAKHSMRFSPGSLREPNPKFLMTFSSSSSGATSRLDMAMGISR
jgi:hypothetical protein